MPRFFVTSSQIENGTVRITGDDAHHLSRSLRAAVGDIVTVCDMASCEYECELTEFLPGEVRARVLSTHPTNTDPPVSVVLYQALPKGDKLDSVIQKAVECGVSRIVPFESERCVVRAKPEAEQRKTERRNRIAVEAAKQCGRGCIPEVLPTVTFDEMIERAGKAQTVLFCYEGEGTEPIPSAIGRIASDWNGESPMRISIMIGSEGGFSPAEAEAAIEAGMIPVGLGKRILRTETASSFVLSCLVYALELQ